MILTIFLILLILGVSAACAAAVIHRHRRSANFLTAHDKSLIHVRWHAIEERLQKGGPTNLRQAVIEADTLVDYVLKKLAVPGTTMGERMRSSQARFSDYQGLWQAHKLRNQIVHELDREVLSFEAKQMIGKFRTALHDLGAV